MLFGDEDPEWGAPPIEMWEYDGVDWTPTPLVHSVPLRRYFSLTFDRGRGVAVLFGGSRFGARQEVWEY